MIKALKSI